MSAPDPAEIRAAREAAGLSLQRTEQG